MKAYYDVPEPDSYRGINALRRLRKLKRKMPTIKI